MFDFDVGKLLLIGVVALIFIPPKDLPEALRMVGRLVGQARRMATDFQSQFHEAMREAELTQIGDGLHDLKQKTSMEGAFSRVADMLEAPAAPKAGASAEAPPAAEKPAPAGPIIVEDQPPPTPVAQESVAQESVAQESESPQAGKPA
ncbi:Sec-independent protein translocase protein TatB [Rhodoblastus sp.]|uniref:Sec-independent protein translocase protein TatB n=1 Tax=Rhodoblastus sp. TaxID=1962975 RepID=UPI003FD8C302